jgi:hypothetical protein
VREAERAVAAARLGAALAAGLAAVRFAAGLAAAREAGLAVARLAAGLEAPPRVVVLAAAGRRERVDDFGWGISSPGVRTG